MANLNWNDMLDRQKAGKKFIQFLIDNSDERDAAFADPAHAREVFQTQGGMVLPQEVEIIAMRNRRPERDNLNIILIPESDPNPDPLTYWIAAWVPYSDAEHEFVTPRFVDNRETGVRMSLAV
jgi:hypothetical protein